MLRECFPNSLDKEKKAEKFERIIPIYCDEGEKMLRSEMLAGLEQQKIAVARVYFQKPQEDCLKIENFYIRPLSPNLTENDVQKYINKISDFSEQINKHKKLEKTYLLSYSAQESVKRER